MGKMPQDLVIYFSLFGNTERVANLIKKKKNAEIVRLGGKQLPIIVPVHLFLSAAKQKVVEIPKIDLSKYNTIYIGGPVWVGKPCPALQYIVSSLDWKNSNVIPFIHYTETPMNSLQEIRKIIEGKGGKVVGEFIVKQNEPEEETLKKI